MKRLIFTMFFMLSLTSMAHATDLIIVLSPYQEAEQAKRQTRQVLQFLTQLEAGQKATIIDGFHLRTIGYFNIPESKLYKSAKARIGANRAGVGALMRFAKKANMNGDAVPSVSGAIRFPQLLRHIAENYAGYDEKIDLIILGSPIYDDPSEPGYSMSGNRVPSDGHFNVSRAKSLYGTSDNPELLSNTRVHFGIMSEGDQVTDQYRYFVKRFWTLFIEKQGGELVSFTSDFPIVFQRAKNHAKTPNHSYKVKPSKKLEMIRLRSEAIEESIYERSVSQKPLPRHKIRHARDLVIGLSWDCKDCDLDLQARPWTEADVIYFNHTKSEQGTHWKDYRGSPRNERAYETIEFHVPVDLRKLQMLVNFYEGNAPHGVKGELRLSVEGKTYATRFDIKAQEGNKAKGVKNAFRTGRASTPHTLMIDPLKIVSLNR